MTPERYLELRAAITDLGYGHDIEWAQTVAQPTSAEHFATEFAYVVCNSGMKAQIARVIFKKVMGAISRSEHPLTEFKHVGKAGAIWDVWTARHDWFARYLAAEDKVEFLGTMPWIGSITKWHLAKNFGVDVAKPDGHLLRVAAVYGKSPQGLCEELAIATGDRIGTVDIVICRACNLGVIDPNAVE